MWVVSGQWVMWPSFHGSCLVPSGCSLVGVFPGEPPVELCSVMVPTAPTNENCRATFCRAACHGLTLIYLVLFQICLLLRFYTLLERSSKVLNFAH